MNKRPGMGRRTMTFFCCVLAMPTSTLLIPGITADTTEHAILAGVVLGVCYLLLRPLLRLLTLPIGCLTLGLFGFVIDAALIRWLPGIIPGFHVEGMLPAIFAALLVDSVCLVAGGFR